MRVFRRHRRRDAEAFGDVVEPETDYEHADEGERPGGKRLADGEAFREVVKTEPGRNRHRQPARGDRRTGGSLDLASCPGHETAVEVDQREEASAQAAGEER